MNIVVIFHNVGGYHAARLRAAHSSFQRLGWHLTAIQVVNQTQEHPWGNVEQEITFSLKTLMPAEQGLRETDYLPSSSTSVPLLTRFLDELKPDILVIPGWGFPVSRTALAWSRRQGIPAILMSESKWDDEPRTWWKEQLKSWLYVRKYSTAIVGGKLHRDYLVQLGMAEDRIFFGYDVVNNEYFAQTATVARQNPVAARQRQPRIPDKPYFLAATRLISRKNVARLIEAYAAYRQQAGTQAWDLVVCGSGVEEPLLRQLLQNQQLEDCVHLPGFVTYHQIGDWYGLAEAFIHPALQEQWGLVVNEACAAGLPILCSRTVGACTELVQDTRNGFVFDPTSTADMTQALLKVHHLSPMQRCELGQCSQQIVAQHSPQSFADGLLKAIHQSLNHHQVAS